MNQLGFLTINSQPAVDGARSDDSTHGWGPKNGYVYQKAYLEFFVGPDLLNDLVRRIEKDPRITYYAVNRQGDLRTNTHSEGPNAVTWGVFPGKEIIQPTIVEAVSFIAWKDEAFELGRQWANMFEQGSKSRELIEQVMKDSYLVNIVANDFRDGLSIFEPFQLGTDNIALSSLSTVKSQSITAKDTPAPAPASAPVPITQATTAIGKAVDGTTETVKSAAETVVNGASSVISAVTEAASSVISPSKDTESPHNDQKTLVDDKSSVTAVEQEPTPTSVGPAPRKQKTMADLEDLFENSPLFMRKAPEPGVENEALDALKSLVFDGTGDGKSKLSSSTSV